MSNEKNKTWWHRSWVFWSFIATGVFVFLALAIASIWWVPGIFVASAAGKNTTPALTPAERVAAVTNARQGVLFIVGGLIAVFTLLITLAKHNLDRQGQELDRDANRTTRYNDAIKQLGDKESFAVRLGGIYALERIAQDSERDRQTILDVLWAYLFSESRRKPDSGESGLAMKTDAAAAATVAGRITQLSPPKNRVVLTYMNLIEAVLAGANLTGVDLTGANLTEAILRHADLTGANLSGANLRFADLGNANFSNANFSYAYLGGTNIRGANISNANFSEAYLVDDDLHPKPYSDVDLSQMRAMNVMGVKAPVTRAYLRALGAIGVDTVIGLPPDKSLAVP